MLLEDKFMPEFYLREPDAYRLFSKHREKVHKFRTTGTLKQIYKKELDKTSFVDGATYADSKNLDKMTFSDKILIDRVYRNAANSNFFDKKQDHY